MEVFCSICSGKEAAAAGCSLWQRGGRPQAAHADKEAVAAGHLHQQRGSSGRPLALAKGWQWQAGHTSKEVVAGHSLRQIGGVFRPFAPAKRQQLQASHASKEGEGQATCTSKEAGHLCRQRGSGRSGRPVTQSRVTPSCTNKGQK